MPDFHFPSDKLTVDVTSGRWMVEVHDVNGEPMQTLKWWHHQGEQSLTVRGVRRKLGVAGEYDEEDEEGYYETMRKLATNCSVM